MGTEKARPRVLTRGGLGNQPKLSPECLAVMRRWLAVFTEHYRQRLSTLALLAYQTELADLTAEQLDSACREALRTSEYMPVVATIRSAHELLRVRNADATYLGPKLLAYPEVSQEERDAAVKESAEFTAKLKAYLGKAQPQVERPEIRPRQSTLSLAEQKKILERRGFLNDGAPHPSACLCPACGKRREQTT